MIITDAIDGWAAKKWTPEWFSEKYPDMRLQTDQGEISMKDFMRDITSTEIDSGPFLREKSIQELFPELMSHVQPTPVYVLPNWLTFNYPFRNFSGRLKRLSVIELNFTGKRIFPYLHIDFLQSFAFISQLYGDKHCVIFPPNQEKFIYRKGTENVSQIFDVENVDLDKYPLFTNAKPSYFVLHAGESVFMPTGWWHTTSVKGPSLATVYSVANSSNWNDVIKDLIRTSQQSPRTARILGYLVKNIGLIKSKFS